MRRTFDPGLIGAPVAAEYEQAARLASMSLFTEAVLRLGRATEAALYQVAREAGLGLTDTSIPDLKNVVQAVQQAQVGVIRRRSIEEVKNLSNISRMLSAAIAVLANDESCRAGCPEDSPKRTEQLFREIIQSTDDIGLQRRLAREQATVRQIQDQRNQAAHATPDGSHREFDPQAYDDMLKQVEIFLETILAVLIGIRAKKSLLETERVNENQDTPDISGGP